jgi:predicted nucleic acid-binding protein
MRIALDTNVLVYAEAANGALMRGRALKLIERLPPGTVALPAQTLGELFHVLVRKAKRRPSRAREAVLSWRDAYPVIETSAAVIVNAADLAADRGLAIWDAVVLAAAAEAGCRLRLQHSGSHQAVAPESGCSSSSRPKHTNSADLRLPNTRAVVPIWPVPLR